MNQISPLKPLAKFQGTAASEASAVAVSLSPGELSSLVSDEISTIRRTEGILNRMEGLLFNEKAVERMTDRDLATAYQMALSRRETSQRFLLRVMEMGVKTTMFSRLFEEAVTPPREEADIPHMAEKIRVVRAQIQEVLDAKLRTPGG